MVCPHAEREFALAGPSSYAGITDLFADLGCKPGGFVGFVEIGSLLGRHLGEASSLHVFNP